MIKTTTILCIATTLLFSCNEQQSDKEIELISPADTLISVTQPEVKDISKDSMLVKRSKEVLNSIKNKDYRLFSTFIHPVDGITFSPYAYILKTDPHFSKNDFEKSLSEGKQIYWGAYAGSGDSISLTIKKYFVRFVYDVDFYNPEKLNVNSSSASGSTINNQNVFYKDLPYIESYFSGFEKTYSGIDWRALRLIFKEYEHNCFLTGIVHDEWTP